MEGTIAVIGATGNIGARVVKKLAERNVKVRAVARNPLKDPLPSGVEPLAADICRPADAARAVRGATAVYFTPPFGGEDPDGDELKAAQNIVEAARDEGIKHFVAHTALQSDRKTGDPLLENKRRVESLITDSGVPYTVLRPAYFLQNLFMGTEHLEKGVFSMPVSPTRRIGMVSVEDVADAAVAFLEKGPQNRGYDLHVPGGTTFGDLCANLGRLMGHPVKYEEFKGDVRAFVDSFPLTAPHKDLYAGLLRHFQKADYVGDAESVKRAIPGFTYTTPEQFAHDELLRAIAH